MATTVAEAAAFTKSLPRPGLAPRTVRLVAQLIDVALVLPLALVMAISAGGALGLTAGTLMGGHPLAQRAGVAVAGGVAWLVLLASGLAFAALTLYQWFLLSTAGQTIGKRLCGIRIVDSATGQPAGFVQALLLRSWVFVGLLTLVSGVAGLIIPLVGTLLGLLDYVPAFGEDRRCLHDYLAGTQVRWVRIVEVKVWRLAGAVAAVALAGAGAAAVVEREAVRAFATPYLARWQQTQAPVTPVAPAPPVPAPPSMQPAPESPVAEAAGPIAAEPAAAEEKELYQFTDAQGAVQVVEGLSAVPPRYRARATRIP